MYEDAYLFSLLVPKEFYLSVFILYFDFVYQKIFAKYPFVQKVFSNKTRLQNNNIKSSESKITEHSSHIKSIIKLAKALTILLLTRGLILTLTSSDNDDVATLVTGALSIIATAYIAVKCSVTDKTSTILKCSINAKDRLKIVIESDILLSFNHLILFQLKQFVPNNIGVLIFVNSYIVSIRFLQCVKERNWLNVAKYGLNYPILYLQYRGDNIKVFYWLKIIQALYGSYWDLFMDWKLQLGIDKRILNRKVTYLLIFVGIVLKFGVLFNHIFQQIALIPLLLEINRRLIWVFLRLDYEYCVL